VCPLRRKTEANNSEDWVLIAEGDLALVSVGVREETSYHSCRSKLAEAVEKLLKAELIRNGWTLEKTHDLDRLLDSMHLLGCDLEKQFEPLCDALAEVYFTDRYPGFDLDDPDWPELRKLVGEVEVLLAEIKGRIKPQSGGG
jgi:HEPN domain-containing protein